MKLTVGGIHIDEDNVSLILGDVPLVVYLLNGIAVKIQKSLSYKDGIDIEAQDTRLAVIQSVREDYLTLRAIRDAAV